MDEYIDDRHPSPGDDPPVTAVVSRRVKQGLMTYVIMPRMTRLFSFWLYPDRR